MGVERRKGEGKQVNGGRKKWGGERSNAKGGKESGISKGKEGT